MPLSLSRFPDHPNRSKLRGIHLKIKPGGDPSDLSLKYLNLEFPIYIRSNYSLGEKFENIGVVESGDWDIDGRIKFEDSESFLALKDHFENGTPLMETSFYRKILARTEKGEILWGCHNIDELFQRCNDIDKLYHSIKNRGYMSQKELGNSAYLDEVTINIGRDGEILFEDGHHRLAIAKLLKLDGIPVIITKRHSEWVKFKKEILASAMLKDYKIYQPLNHPDLSDIPSMHSDKRWNIIKDHLPIISGSVLDLGAQWGYFSAKFEELGFDCYAVENNPKELYFLNKLKKFTNKNFKVIPKSILDLESLDSYDVILGLNIFHHFLKSKKDFEKFKMLLNKIDSKYMFFEPHSYNEIQMQNAFINFHDKEFLKFISDNSCFKKYDLIGSDEDGRNLYLLSK